MTTPGYTFVPWLRRGAATAIDWDDDPHDTNPQHVGRSTATAELVLGYEPVAGGPPPNPAAPPTVTRSIELLGPGDIRTLRPDTIMRVFPEPDSRTVTPGELAYVEFYEEDLPWRYTPARPVHVTVAAKTRPRLRPWLALFVLLEGEFDVRLRTADTPVLTIHNGIELPPEDEAWAWAHAQLAGDITDASGADAGQRIAANPNAALSRLLSPRRLVPGALYTAFVVPAFNAGRLAGIGEPWANEPAMRPSWGPDVDDRRFPVYHSWSFTTSTDGSFESIVRRLTAQRVGEEFGKREVRVVAPGFGIDPDTLPSTLDLEGALAPEEFPRDGYPADAPGTDAAVALQGAIDTGPDSLDPGLAPPAYGRWHADVTHLSDVDDSDPEGWVREVNLDLRERAVAGLGAAIVRARQDDLLQRAWRQVGELRDANQRLREGELAVAAAESMFSKHLKSADTDRALLVTAPAHHGIAVDPGSAGVPVPSLWAVLRASGLPGAVLDAAFTRLTRPGTALVAQALPDGTLLSALGDGSLSAAPPIPASANAVDPAKVEAAVTADAAAAAAQAGEPWRVLWRLLVDILTAMNANSATLVLPTVPALRAELTRLGPGDPRVSTLIGAIVDVRPEGRYTALIVLDRALYLAEIGNVARVGGRGVVITCTDPPGTTPRPVVDDGDGPSYIASLRQLTKDLDGQQPPPVTPMPADLLPDLAQVALDGVRPAVVLERRIRAALPGLPEPAGTRRLRPVLAYPVFNEPMFEALRALDPAYILPNIGALPEDTITLMVPNGRFIEAFFAGLNTEMARELLWREYPTDQRGSYFRVFWSHADAPPGTTSFDVERLDRWHAPLGSNTTMSGTPVVLVMRSELLRKFPRTLVYAQAGRLDANKRRTLDQTAPPQFPVFQATADPDVAMFGFDLRGDLRGNPDQGDAGMYFVLKERAGQIRFGLDTQAPKDGFGDWDDLWWGQMGSTRYARLGQAGAASMTPTDPGTAVWAATAADMASILIRGQVMYARHADDMLPEDET